MQEPSTAVKRPSAILHRQNATELTVWPIWGLSDCQNLQLQSSHHQQRTQVERNRANGMANMAASQWQIARTFNCSQATISILHRQNATELTVWPIWRPLNGRLQEPSTAVKHHQHLTQAERNRANGMANMAASQLRLQEPSTAVKRPSATYTGRTQQITVWPIWRPLSCKNLQLQSSTISIVHRQNATELTVWPIWRPLNGRLQEPSTAVKRPSAILHRQNATVS